MITPDNSKKGNNCGLYDCTRENGCMSRNWGGSNRSKYDTCQYERDLMQSTSTGNYRMYQGAYENCDKCIYERMWFPFSDEIVMVENDLKNLTRPLSNCPQYKYSPACKKSGSCFSTFDPSAPVVIDGSLCPVVFNNIPKTTHNGLKWPSADFCKK